LEARAQRRSRRSQCVESYRRLAAAFVRDEEQLWLTLDLTMGQLKAMAALDLHGPLPVGGLGRILGLSEPAASLLVDQLEERGLAHREQDPSDGRRVLVTPRPEALERVGAFRRGRATRVSTWLDRLTDDDLEALKRGLAALADVADAESVIDPSQAGAAPSRPGGRP
jgi:DNA-binding MarR family transcriptional regulator